MINNVDIFSSIIWNELKLPVFKTNGKYNGKQATRVKNEIFQIKH